MLHHTQTGQDAPRLLRLSRKAHTLERCDRRVGPKNRPRRSTHAGDLEHRVALSFLPSDPAFRPLGHRSRRRATQREDRTGQAWAANHHQLDEPLRPTRWLDPAGPAPRARLGYRRHPGGLMPPSRFANRCLERPIGLARNLRGTGDSRGFESRRVARPDAPRRTSRGRREFAETQSGHGSNHDQPLAWCDPKLLRARRDGRNGPNDRPLGGGCRFECPPSPLDSDLAPTRLAPAIERLRTQPPSRRDPATLPIRQGRRYRFGAEHPLRCGPSWLGPSGRLG